MHMPVHVPMVITSVHHALMRHTMPHGHSAVRNAPQRN